MVTKAAIPWQAPEGPQCRTCGVPGCARCADLDRCERCDPEFVLDEGQRTCTWQYSAPLTAAAVAALAVLVWVLVDLARAQRRPLLNPFLDAALQTRARLKVRDMTKPGYPQYPLSQAIHFRSPLGVGTVLCRGSSAPGRVKGGGGNICFLRFPLQFFSLCSFSYRIRKGCLSCVSPPFCLLLGNLENGRRRKNFLPVESARAAT